jgi:ABC-type phosphate transport system substrate-binding protein
MKTKTNIIKKSVLWLALTFALLGFPQAVQAQEINNAAQAAANSKEVIHIKSARFAAPLLEKWIAEYTAANPSVQFIIADKNAKQDEVDINLVISDFAKDDLQAKPFSLAVGRYVVLPFAGTKNTLLDELQKKKLNERRLKELFFEKDVFAEDYDPEDKDKYHATVYSVNHPASISSVFADHFDNNLSGLKGKKIAGDDIYLINAVQKDNTGVSFNYLNYLYDVNSRQLKSNIALLPLDLKKEYSDILSEDNLDKTIALLESKTIDIIPIEEFAFTCSNNKLTPAIQQFLIWVLSDGQTYNHQYGLLQLDEKKAKQELIAYHLNKN